MANIAGFLSRSAHRPVLDQTGVPGKFRFSLEVATNLPRSSPNPFDLEPPQQPDPNSPAPDILTAIRQLGLQVVDAPNGSYQYIKVDQVEKPSEN